MSLVERDISRQANVVLHKLESGQSVDQVEAVGLAQEIVRLSRQHAAAVEDSIEAGQVSMQAAFWRARALELGASPDEWKLHAAG